VRVLNRIKAPRGVSKMLFGDSGSKFSSQAMDLWAYHNGVRIDFSRSGKPTTMRTSSHSTAAFDSRLGYPRSQRYRMNCYAMPAFEGR
jgi:transposase InsO family protein